MRVKGERGGEEKKGRVGGKGGRDPGRGPGEGGREEGQKGREGEGRR